MHERDDVCYTWSVRLIHIKPCQPVSQPATQYLYLRVVYFSFGLYVLAALFLVQYIFFRLRAILFLSHSNIEYWIHRALISFMLAVFLSRYLFIFLQTSLCSYTMKPFYVITATCMPLIVQTLIIRYYASSFITSSLSFSCIVVINDVFAAFVVVVVVDIIIIWQTSVSTMNFWNCFHFHTPPISFCHTFVENGNRATDVLSFKIQKLFQYRRWSREFRHQFVKLVDFVFVVCFFLSLLCVAVWKR